jgi:hypothetical protein
LGFDEKLRIALGASSMGFDVALASGELQEFDTTCFAE